MILDEVKEAFVKDLMARGKRVDGRGLLDYREIGVEKNVFPNAEGSALARIGDTKVFAATKFAVMEPYPDKPNEGVVAFGSEFSPIAHPEFEAGPPNENSIELARVVDRGIRSAGVVDTVALAQADGKVLGLFVDLHVVDHSGNLIDCAALAAMAALTVTKVPKYADGKIERSELTPLKINQRVVTTSFEKISGKTILDATDEEEIASDGRLTLATADGGLLCAAQKSGAVGFKPDELLALMDVANKKREELVKFL